MSETIEMSVVVIRETPKAFLVDDGEEHWIPKSQITDAEEYGEGEEATIEVSLWFATKEGLA